ncbi:MAG TPA: hypothetical protein VMN39_01320 [Longimicrobiaceae bacterium]|nr:hypothetical protein [Longimicrobiaceae bacterium]
MLVRPALETLPYGSPLRVWTLSDSDAWLRHHMMFGAPDQALTLLGSRASPISDDLLRSMQRALVLRQSGDFEGSNELLEWAELEAERRSVRSVSRTAGSFIINDRVLGYSPSPGELGMISYYRMMNYLALQDLAAAAVEARRLSNRLDSAEGGEVPGCREEAMLRYLAGIAFEAAGELNDGLVALRRSEASFRSCAADAGISPPSGFGADLYRVAHRLGVRDVADSARAHYSDAAVRYAPGAGEVLLVFERGFVAHLTEEYIDVPLIVEEVSEFGEDDTDEIAKLAASIATGITLGYRDRGTWGSSVRDGQYGRRRPVDIDDVYFLRLAWPGIRRDSPQALSIRVLTDTDSAAAARVGDLSAVAEHDLDARRGGMLARLVTRGILKYVISREMEKKAEEEGGRLLGTLTGFIANAAASELERADTRSWSLLPDEVSVARLTLPEGNHRLRVQSLGPGGELSGTIELGTVQVGAGRMTVVHHRLWADDLSGLTLPGGEEGVETAP